MTKCVAVWMDETESQLSVNSPNGVYKCWTCTMIGVSTGIQTIKLSDIDPLDQSKENWQAAQDAAIALMTGSLEERVAVIQQQLNELKNLTARKEPQI